MLHVEESISSLSRALSISIDDFFECALFNDFDTNQMQILAERLELSMNQAGILFFGG